MSCTYAGLPCLDPTALLIAAERLGVSPEPWWGRANRFSCPVGPTPGQGLLLMARAHVASLASATAYPLVFSDGQGPPATLARVYFVRAWSALPGSRGDAAQPYWVEVADVRYFAQASVIDKAYNVRRFQAGDYLESTLVAGLNPFTWAELVADVWDHVPLLGAFPGLPFLPDGTPDGFEFYGSNAYWSLNLLLERLGCALQPDPTAGEWGIVRLATDDDAAEAALAKRDPWQEWDGDPIQALAAQTPATVRVHFVKHYPGPVCASPGESLYYWIDVAGTGKGSVGGTYALVYDDLPAIYSSNGEVLLNGAALTSRAAERASDYYRRASDTPFDRLWFGALSEQGIRPGSRVGALSWQDTGAGALTRASRQQLLPAGPPGALGLMPALPGADPFALLGTFGLGGGAGMGGGWQAPAPGAGKGWGPVNLALLLEPYLRQLDSGWQFWCQDTEIVAGSGSGGGIFLANDWSPPADITRAAVVYRLSTAGDFTLTGITPAGACQMLVLHNINAGADPGWITLSDLDDRSAESHQFDFVAGLDVIIPPGGAVILWYDPVDLRWKLLARSFDELIGCMVFNVGTLSVTASTGLIMSWDSRQFDTGGFLSGPCPWSAVTLPFAGLYEVHCELNWTAFLNHDIFPVCDNMQAESRLRSTTALTSEIPNPREIWDTVYLDAGDISSWGNFELRQHGTLYAPVGGIDLQLQVFINSVCAPGNGPPRADLRTGNVSPTRSIGWNYLSVRYLGNPPSRMLTCGSGSGSGSSGSGGGGAITSTGLGHASGTGQTLQLGPVTVPAGATLVVQAAVCHDATLPQGCSFAGSSMGLAVQQGAATGSLTLYSLKVTSTTTGTITFSGPPARSDALLLSAEYVQGLAAGTLDKTASASGTSAAPDSGATAITSSNNEYVQGACLTQHAGTVTGTWGGGFTDGGQDATNATGYRLQEGYQIPIIAGTFDASLTTGGTSCDWIAAVATFQ